MDTRGGQGNEEIEKPEPKLELVGSSKILKLNPTPQENGRLWTPALQTLQSLIKIRQERYSSILITRKENSNFNSYNNKKYEFRCQQEKFRDWSKNKPKIFRILSLMPQFSNLLSPKAIITNLCLEGTFWAITRVGPWDSIWFSVQDH